MKEQAQNPEQSQPPGGSSQPGNNEQAQDLGNRLFDFLDEKKAGNLALLHITPVNSYFGYFLVGTATSQVHLNSLLREVRTNFSDEISSTSGKGGGPRPENTDSGWEVIDFIDVVVHLFLEEQRQFYNLERLWGDAEVLRSSEA